MLGRLKNPTPVCSQAVEHLIKVKVNFLAIDFDQTFINIHTGGVWQRPVEELIPHARQEFKDLVTTAMDSGIHVAIVTFSRQPLVIKGVLESVVGAERAARIPVRGNDSSWKYVGTGSHEGKQAHMASAVEELEQSENIKISKSTTLLIDDDRRNIKVALDDGVRAVLFSPNHPQALLRDILKLP